MTREEIRQTVETSKNKAWLNKLELHIELPYLGFKKTFTGFLPIYDFLKLQADGWQMIKEKLPPELERSKSIFVKNLAQLENLPNEQSGIYGADQTWRYIENEFRQTKNILLYEAKETKLLIGIFKQYPENFAGAFEFITDKVISSSFSRQKLTGYLMAHEFIKKNRKQDIKQEQLTSNSEEEIRNKFYEFFNKSEQEFIAVTERITSLQKTREEQYDGWFNKSKTETEELQLNIKHIFDNWYADIKKDFELFHNTASEKVQSLENVYNEFLSLNEPAKYWRNRAEKLKKEGKGFLRWLIILVIFGCISLYSLLWLTPGGMLLSFIKGDASAIKWSVIYVTFIAFIAYGIRTLAKVMFSSFHLARDAEEREHLTLVYMAMLKDASVSTEDRQLIMQSLFSRADTGLLKDDGNPTMPGSIVEKIAGK